MNEPTQFRAGDTVEWTASHGDYLASAGWALTYYLRGTSTLDISGVADGDDFDITISATDSAALAAGKYVLQGRFSKAGEVFTPDGFVTTVEILPNIYAQVAGYDGRTHARKALDLVEAAIEKYIADPIETLTIANRSYTITRLEDLFRLKKRYEYELKKEQDAERVAKGLGRKRIKFAFGATS